MKKFKIHNYSVVFLISFLVLFLLFYSIMLKSFTDLPSENWSKEIPIQTFVFPSGSFIASQYTIYDCIPYNDGLLLSYVDEKGIHMKHLNLNFEVIQESFTPFQVDDNLRRLDLTTDQSGHYQLNLYTLDQKSIKVYNLVLPSFELISEIPEIPQVETYTFIENSIFYVKDHFLYGSIEDDPFPIGSVEDVSGLTGFKSKGTYTLLSVESINAKRFLVTYTFDNTHEHIKKTILSPLVSDTSVSFQSLSAIERDEMLHVITVLRNAKTNYNLANFQTFEIQQFKLISDDVIPFSSYIPYPFLFSEENTLKIGFIDTLQLGRIDVSRKHSSYPNYAVSTLENGKIGKAAYLTKTENTKINPVYYEFNHEKVLVWMEYTGSHFKIFGSGNDASVIQKSQRLALSDYFAVFMNSITTFFSLFYTSLVLIFSVTLPIIVLYSMLSFFKITWVERYGHALLQYMIIGHILLKFYSFIPTIKMTLVHMDGLNFFYSTFTGQIMFTLGLTLISLVSFRMYYKAHRQVGAFVHYLRFALLDCLLLITAFYPMYVV